MRPTSAELRAGRGFTLVELITALVVTAILATMSASFLQVPVQSFFDINRRAALTDIADLSLRRISRDVRAALPNSVRVSGACNGAAPCYLEYLDVRTGGRYREEPSGAATTCPAPGGGVPGYNDALEAGIADGCFMTLGATPGLAGVAAGDFVVVYNLGPGFAGSDAYASGPATGGNKSLIAGTVAGAGANPEDRFNFANLAFPLGSPGRRFHVVSGPVTYACNPAAAGGTLVRHSGYGIAAAQATPPAGGTAAVLATGVTSCAFSYTANAVAQRNGVVLLSLQLTQTDATGQSDRVDLVHQIHVSNTP